MGRRFTPPQDFRPLFSAAQVDAMNRAKTRAALAAWSETPPPEWVRLDPVTLERWKREAAAFLDRCRQQRPNLRRLEQEREKFLKRWEQAPGK